MSREMVKQTILVVDDDPGVLKSIVEILEDEGYIVLRTTNPLAAFGMAREPETKIDLVITDSSMPFLNGVELMERFRAVGMQTKFILCTATTQEQGDILKKLGFEEVILKPPSLPEIVSTVAIVLRGF